MSEDECGPMTEESRLTSPRQPSVAKKCGTGEEKREVNGPGQRAAQS